jgi:hypothetical protein
MPMDKVGLCQRRAEECSARGLESPDEDHLMQSVQMALYRFDQAEVAARFYHHTPYENVEG